MNTAIETFEGVRIFLSLPTTTRMSDTKTFLRQILKYPVEFRNLSYEEYITVQDISLKRPAKLKKSESGEIVAIGGAQYLTFKCVRGKHFFAGKVCYTLPFPHLGDFMCVVWFWGVPDTQQLAPLGASQPVLLRTNDEVFMQSSIRIELFCYPVASAPPREIWSLSRFPTQLFQAPGTYNTASITLWLLGKTISLVLLQPTQVLASFKSSRAHNFVVCVNKSETFNSVKADLTQHIKATEIDYLIWAKEEIVDLQRTVDSYLLSNDAHWKLVFPEDIIITVADLYGTSLTLVFQPSDEVWKVQSEIQSIPLKWYWFSEILFETTVIAHRLTFAASRIPSGSTITVLRDQDFLLPIQSFDRSVTHRIGVSQKVSSVREIKARLSALFQVPIERCGLYCWGKLINKLMLKEYSISAGVTLYMTAGNYALTNANLQVFAYFYDESAAQVSISIGSTVNQLKKMICSERSLPFSESAKILFEGKLIENELRLLDADIRSNDTLFFVSPTDIVITARLSPRAEFAVAVTANATVLELKKTIQRFSRLPFASMSVRKAGKELADEELLHTCGFRDGDTVEVSFPTSLSLVVQPIGSKPFSMECEQTDTVQVLKQRIAATRAVPMSEHTLTFGCQPLEDGKLLSDYDLCTADCLYLLPPSSFFITVQTALGSCFPVPVTSRYTVKNVKQTLHKQIGLSVDALDLYYSGELGDKYPVRQLEKVFPKDSVTYQVMERTEHG